MEIELDPVPTYERCAQTTMHNFREIARIEAEVFIAALKAKNGPPPPGTSFFIRSNPHDFGTYPSVVFSIHLQQNKNNREEILAYWDRIELGLDHWLQAGFTAPIDYDSNGRSTAQRTFEEALDGAFRSTRPNPDGTFPYPEAETLHANLTRCFPDAAIRFEQWFKTLT